MVEKKPPPWKSAFTVETPAVAATNHDAIWLAQVSRDKFDLHSTIHYRGDTGLDKFNLSEETNTFIRSVGPDPHDPTDLASVPGPLRWFMNSYGAHTPAALIHDRLIGNKARPPELTDQMADRYFRFMLESVNVSWLSRWIMWAGIALRSRFATSWFCKLALGLWVILAFCGMASLAVAIIRPSWILFGIAIVLPFVAALLLGPAYRAGLVAALVAPWLLPPSVLAAAGYLFYLVLEKIIGIFAGPKLTLRLQPDAPEKPVAPKKPAAPAERPATAEPAAEPQIA